MSAIADRPRITHGTGAGDPAQPQLIGETMSTQYGNTLVADATLATFPANDSPRFATNAAISFAALDQLVTQVSWIKYQAPKKQLQ